MFNGFARSFLRQAGGLFGIASPDWNQVNAIDRSATRGETLRCGFNQGIHLGSIKGGMSSIQFKIGFPLSGLSPHPLRLFQSSSRCL
jgi:hypothetical protein